MKTAVMAAGGVGGYFGARLAEAGHDVAFIARGAHLRAIREGGLRVESALGDIHLAAPRVTDDPAEIGPVDYVVFAVKLGDMETAAEACRALIGPDTAVIPFVNGVDAPATLSRILGPAHACGGASYISAKIGAPGKIQHLGPFARLAFGELDDRRSARLEAFLAICADSGIEAKMSTEIDLVVWEKFMLLVAMSGITAAARSAIGPIRDEPLGRDVFAAAMAEVVAVGRARGIRFSDDVMERQLSIFNGLPHDMKASQLMDLEIGKPLEAPWLSGAVSRMGREHGVPTPVNDTLYTVLRPHVGGTAAG